MLCVHLKKFQSLTSSISYIFLRLKISLLNRVSLFSKKFSQTAQSWSTGAFWPTNHQFGVKNYFRQKTFLRTAVKVLAKRYITSKFQSCPIHLKLKIQSLLTLLNPKKLSLSILDHKCGSLFSTTLPHLWSKIDKLSFLGF